MNSKLHYEFTLWIFDWERNEEKVPAIIFEEGSSFDEILLTMLSLEHLGLYCSLTCDSWTNSSEAESEDVKND